jgi:hypothetical protein
MKKSKMYGGWGAGARALPPFPPPLYVSTVHEFLKQEMSLLGFLLNHALTREIQWNKNGTLVRR